MPYSGTALGWSHGVALGMLHVASGDADVIVAAAREKVVGKPDRQSDCRQQRFHARPPPGTAVRDVEAERLRGLQIDHEFVLGRLLNRQIGRLLAFKDAIDIGGDPTVQTNQVRLHSHT